MQLAEAFQQKHRRGERKESTLDGRVVAMIFEKPSLRTKVAFEVAAASLGATPVFLSSSQIMASGNDQRGRESIQDIGKNLERFADILVARVYHHEIIRELADTVSKPVINALCDRYHPTQALADLMAIRWHKKETRGLKVAFVGDGNNVATSLMHMSLMAGMEFAIASPKGYAIPVEEQASGRQLARTHNTKISFLHESAEAVAGADVVYTDTFVSMGQEAEKETRATLFAPYQVNPALMKAAKDDAIFMHCLPAHRGEEVTNNVIDSSQSIVFDQAECRLHVVKALLVTFLTGS